MKLLLVYPQQANKSDQRVSRAGAQLHGIAQTTREFFDSYTNAGVQINELAYENDNNVQAVNAEENRKRLAPALDETDLIIDISPTPEVNVAPSDYAGPVIHLSPTFSGSFVCNDINAVGCGRLSQADVVRSAEQANDKHKYTLPSTHELDANMHYASFSALPTRVGDAFYRNEKDHALVFLGYSAQERNDETINNDLQILADILHSVETLRSITFVCETLADLPLIQQVSDGLRESLGLQPSIWGLRRGDYHDMYSIMAKSNVVLCGGSKLYADAIIRGIPVFPWRNKPGTESIAETYTAHLSDRDHTVEKQRRQLDQLIDAQYLDGAIPNYRPCFESMLAELINNSLQKEVIDLNQPVNSSNPQWVVAPARLTEQRNLPDKFSRSLWNERQKLLQFKQSENREIVRRNESGDRPIFTRL